MEGRQRSTLGFVVIDNKTSQPPVRSEFDKMVAGEWYRYRFGPELAEMTTSTQRTCRKITAVYDDDQPAAHALFAEMLGTVGAGVDFRPPLYLDYGSQLHVGANTFINADFLTLGGGEITIEDDVWLGGNVVVCPGVNIGAGSIIGAGSVVTKDVPAGVIAAGNPARVVRAIGPGDRIGLGAA